MGSERLDSSQLDLEKMMLALRTSDGLHISWLEARTEKNLLRQMLGEGSLINNTKLHCPGTNVRIPESSFFVSDSIIARLARHMH